MKTVISMQKSLFTLSEVIYG